MKTQFFISINARDEVEAVSILSGLLTKLSQHSFPEPHNNDCGTWVYKWSNFPSDDEDEDY
jgi:hypothetical protein